MKYKKGSHKLLSSWNSVACENAKMLKEVMHRSGKYYPVPTISVVKLTNLHEFSFKLSTSLFTFNDVPVFCEFLGWWNWINRIWFLFTVPVYTLFIYFWGRCFHGLVFIPYEFPLRIFGELKWWDMQAQDDGRLPYQNLNTHRYTMRAMLLFLNEHLMKLILKFITLNLAHYLPPLWYFYFHTHTHT